MEQESHSMGVIKIFGVVRESPAQDACLFSLTPERAQGSRTPAVGAAVRCLNQRERNLGWDAGYVREIAQLACRKASKKNVNVHRNKQCCYQLHCFGFSSPGFVCLADFNWSGIKLLHLQDWSLELQSHGNLSGYVKSQLPRKKNYVLFIPNHLVYACSDARVRSNDTEPFTCLLHKNPREKGSSFLCGSFQN